MLGTWWCFSLTRTEKRRSVIPQYSTFVKLRSERLYFLVPVNK